MFSITQVRRHAHTEKGRQYFVERFPRFDSSKMHSWFPAWQRLQGGPFSAPTHFIFSRRHTIHALIAHFSIQARGRRATRTVIHASTSVWERRHLCPLLDFQPRRHHRLCGSSSVRHRTVYVRARPVSCRWNSYWMDLELAGAPWEVWQLFPMLGKTEKRGLRGR